MRVLIVSNLDSREPFGQFLRPFHLGRGLAGHGVTVANVGVDCSRVDFGPSWSTGVRSLGRLARATALATERFAPDVVYGHEMRGAMAAVLGAPHTPLVSDFHSVPSIEWAGYAREADPAKALVYRAAGWRTAAAERLVSRRARHIIAAGPEVGRDVFERHRPSAPITVISNGVGAELLDRERDGGSPYGPGRHAVTTIPGAQSVSNVRALEFLQRACAAMNGSAEPVSVHVLGSTGGPGATNLRYEGFQPDLLPWITEADACLLPYPDEAALAGGPRNKLLEYLALGRRLVTTREGLRGLPDVEHWPGVTVTANDPGAFAAAVERVARREAETLDNERAREQLRWERLAGQALEVLQSVARPAG